MIPLSECVVRGIYKIHSRNLLLAVYIGNRAFVGLREKFDYIYLDTEWADTGPNPNDWLRGAWAKEFVGLLPESICLWSGRKDAEGNWETDEALRDYLTKMEDSLFS